jgi:outer membrane protein assembly factor BamB
MLLRILRYAAISLAIVGLTAAILYQFFGLRVVLLGGGRPTLAFVTSAEAQANAIEQHRAAQAAETPAVAVPTAAEQPSVAAASEKDATTTAATTTPAAAASSDWPFFRGPRWDGHYTAQPVNLDWQSLPNRELKPVWKQPVGGGYASFVTAPIAGTDAAFTIEQRGRQEVVAAYDVATGRELWTNAWTAEFREFMGGDGPRATPTWFDNVVFAQGATGELRAINASTGATLWRTNILTDAGATNIQWGMSGSPLIVDDLVVTMPGGSRGKAFIAYDRHTGSQRWSAHNDRAGYSSPMLVTIDGVRQILTVTATRIVGLDPTDGSLLWEHPWVTMYDVNAGQPLLIGNNRVFMSSGYDHGAVVIEITMGDGRASVKEIWQNNRMKNQFTSSVLHDGFIYGLDESILACVDAATGTLKWKGGRYGYGQVALVDGHLIVLTEDGDMALVHATPDRHEELTRFPVLDGKTWNHPAFSHGRLLVRNLSEMAMFDLRR